MKYYLLLFMALSCQLLSAQAPQAIGFQGLAYGPDTQPLAEENITVKIEILESSPQGVGTYVENHDITTNASGLYDLKIGRGAVEQGNFSDLNWANEKMYLKVSLSTDGLEFLEAGTTEFLSVPYALVAGSAEPTKKIFVSENPHVDARFNVFQNEGNNNASFNYFYEWIDGTPEDVLIEYVGLPDEVCLETTSMGGFTIKENIIIDSHVDTIRGGVMLPRSRFIRCDPDVDIPKGTYDLDLNFKIGDKVLGSISHKLDVDPIYYEDCFGDLPLNLSIEENTCDQNIIDVDDTVLITGLNNSTINISSPISDDLLELNFRYIGCESYSEYFDIYGPGPNISVRYEMTEGQLIFEIEYDDYDNEIEHDCKVVYQEN